MCRFKKIWNDFFIDIVLFLNIVIIHSRRPNNGSHILRKSEHFSSHESCALRNIQNGSDVKAREIRGDNSCLPSTLSNKNICSRKYAQLLDEMLHECIRSMDWSRQC